jgi:hypothetical protein
VFPNRWVYASALWEKQLFFQPVNHIPPGGRGVAPTNLWVHGLIAAPAPTSALIGLAAEGPDISPRFLTALPRRLALGDDIRLSLVAVDACRDIRIAVVRLRRCAERN